MGKSRRGSPDRVDPHGVDRDRTDGQVAEAQLTEEPHIRTPSRGALYFELCQIGEADFGDYVARHARAAGVPAETARTCRDAGATLARWARTGDVGVGHLELAALLDGIAQLLAGKSAAVVPPYTLDGVVLRAGYARIKLRDGDSVSPTDLWALSTAVAGEKTGLSKLERDAEGNIAASAACLWLRDWGVEA